MTSRKVGLEKGAQEISPRIAAKGGGMILYLGKRRGKGSSLRSGESVLAPGLSLRPLTSLFPKSIQNTE